MSLLESPGIARWSKHGSGHEGIAHGQQGWGRSGPAPASGETTTFPPQHWASKVGWVDLKPNGVALESSNVLDRLLIQEAFYRWGIAWDEARLEVVRSLFTKEWRTGHHARQRQADLAPCRP